MIEQSKVQTTTIAVVGADGYIGSVLIEKLANENYRVVGFDAQYYSDVYLYPPKKEIEIKHLDTRDINTQDLVGVEILFCLADLTDPISQAYPDATHEINDSALRQLARTAKQTGVKRFIYSSSASVYGFAGEEPMTEESRLSPLTPYAKCKVEMEQYLAMLSDESFTVACLRNATVYGLSPRMRFDLVVNYLCGTAVARNKVELHSDGKAWRPFVHIDDLTDAFIQIMKLPDNDFDGLIVNVGDTNESYTIHEVANIISTASGCEITADLSNHDRRSYRISSQKLNQLGIHCSHQLRTEVEGIIEYLKTIQLDEKTLMKKSFMRKPQIDTLLKQGKIDGSLRWV